MNSSRFPYTTHAPASFAPSGFRIQASAFSSALRSVLLMLAAVFGLFGSIVTMGATPYVMSSGNYSENFSDIANWANDFTSGTGSTPWASYPITAGGTANDGKRTTKSSAIFVAGSAGGLQKGTLNLAFLSTGSIAPSEAVAVDLLLNFTGRNAGTLSFDWAAIDNSSGTRPTSLRVYWSTENSTFTEISSAQVLDVQSPTTGSITTVALPSAFNNSSTARLRFYNHAGTVTGSGNRDKISIDNLAITSSASSTAVISGAATASVFTTTYGTSSAVQTFSVSGTGLTVDITATAPTGFEVSSDGTNYGTTATFTQTSGTVSGGSLRVRLKATAIVAGTYNAQSIVLSSAGAASVSVTTSASGNSVGAKGVAVTGLVGVNKFYDGTTNASSSGTAAYTGLENGETFSVVGTPVASFVNAAAGIGKTVSVTGYSAPSGNYSLTQPSLTANIDPRPLTVTANNLTKTQGATLTSSSGSIDFISSGLVSPQTIGSVTVSYGAGAATGDPAGSYPGSITPSEATGGSFTASNYDISYVAGDLTVSASPTITTSGTLSAVSTIYGTASTSPTSFTVAGGFLTGDLTVAAPPGIEISTTPGSGYGGSLNLPAPGGNVSSTPIYVRLSALTGAGAYSGNVVVSGGGAALVNVATASSTVVQATLAISGLAGVNKDYDGGTTATVTGTPTYVGLVNGEAFSVSGTPSASYATKTIGNGKAITVTGYTAPTANYAVTQPTGLTADIHQSALTVSGASAIDKTYDGTAVATISGASLVGVISPDAVTIATSTGTFADGNVGTGIAVTAALTLGGADAANYTLTQPVGLTGNITQASQTITFAALSAKETTDAPFALTATASSGLTVNYASDTLSVATVSGATVTIVGAGSTVITATQTGNGNYAAASSVTRNLSVVLPAPNLVVSRLGNGTQTLTASGNSVFLDQYNASSGALVQTVTVPDSGANAVVQSGASSSEGALMRSPDGKFLSFPGYKAAVGGGTSGATSIAVPRVAVTVNGANTIAVAATTTAQFSLNNIRSAATDGANNFWGAGGNSGTCYLGNGTPAAVQTATTNTRVVDIVNGNLYFSTGSATGNSGVGIYSFSGLPTASATPSLVFTVGGTSPSPYGFAFNPAGTMAYVADDRGNASGGVLRYDKSGSVWSLTYTLGTGATNIGARGVTVDWSGASPVVYATTAETSLNRLIKIVDTGSASAATTLAISGTNRLFRGIAFAPVPAITSQPINQTVISGSGVTLSAAASGTPAPTAQWQVSTDGGANFSNIVGATSITSYSFIPVVADSGKKYRVVYNNVNGAAISSVVTLTVNPVVLAPDDISLSQTGGVYTATATGVSGFTYTYFGTSYAASSSAPTTPGFYTVTATSSDPNYTGSKSESYFIAGAIAVNDGVTRQAGSAGIKIPVATLLGNDSQVTAGGELLQSGLSISSVTSGAGNSVSVSGAFVFYTPSTPADSAPLMFTYVLSNGAATATVTVSTIAATPFTLDIIRVVTVPVFDGTSTSVTVEFAGIPGQIYQIACSPDMINWSDPPLSVPTGDTGTFNATFTKEGDQTSAWSSLYFRASR